MNTARIEFPVPRPWTINPRGRNSICALQAEIEANPFRFCTCTAARSNSFIFCTYKIASHLHILQVLKTNCFHGFARFSGLTTAFSAHTRLPGGVGYPGRGTDRADP